MDVLVATATGIVLAASAGLRAFMPLFAAGVAARTLGWDLAPRMQWLSSDAALLVFGIATVVEVVADKIPLLDHALDAVHTILGPIAGAVAGLSVWLHFPPVVAAVLALVIGVPVAGGVHVFAATARIKSTVLTGGSMNPVASLIEDVLSVGAIALAVLVPLIALALVVALLIVLGRRVRRASRPSANV